jgi:ribosome-associated heat shock protein Hsp15
MEAVQTVRIDKWLWAVRIFKTRTQAAEECHKGRVNINNMPVKPSREIKLGEIITVRKPPILYTYKVTGIIDSRVAAKEAIKHVENLTPEEEIAKLHLIHMGNNFQRDPGTGRPTKRDRRMIDKLKSDE